MSVATGASIVTSGLVFDYDMTNEGRSWNGAPTTNLYSAVNPYLDGNGNDWTNSGAGTWNYNDTTIAPPYVANGSFIRAVLRISSCVVTTSGNLQVGMGITSVSPSTTYTMSIWVYQTSSTVFQSAPYMRTNVNNNAIAYFAYNGSTDSTTWPTNQWIRISATGTTQANENGIYLSSYIGTTVGDKVYYYGFQVEQTSIMSALAAGTRSNTQALYDLTQNNIITANSLTYSSDNTFSFNGSSNYMDCGNASAIAAISGTSTVSVESWVNLSGYGSTSGYGVITHKGYPWAWLLENPSNTMRIRFYLSNSGDVSCPDSTTHALNTWYQFVGTYDGSNMKFYRNGVLTNTISGSGTLGGSGANMIVGAYSGAYFAQGQIPIVKIYNKALSAQEVSQNFNALRGRYGI